VGKTCFNFYGIGPVRIRLSIPIVGFVEEIIKNRVKKRDNKYAEEIKLFYSKSNCSHQRYNK